MDKRSNETTSNPASLSFVVYHEEKNELYNQDYE